MNRPHRLNPLRTQFRCPRPQNLPWVYCHLPNPRLNLWDLCPGCWGTVNPQVEIVNCSSRSSVLLNFISRTNSSLDCLVWVALCCPKQHFSPPWMLVHKPQKTAVDTGKLLQVYSSSDTTCGSSARTLGSSLWGESFFFIYLSLALFSSYWQNLVNLRYPEEADSRRCHLHCPF